MSRFRMTQHRQPQGNALTGRHAAARLPTRFLDDETGAISAEWVVLAALATGMAALTSETVSDGVLNLADSLIAYMSDWNFD